MKAVWSLWTKPALSTRKLSWYSELHHLLGWVLSVQTARKHFPTTSIFTDDRGAELLVRQLGLQFDEVSTDLNELRDYDANWWTLGKIATYRRQTVPFVHIDTDVFLWKPLPSRLMHADVIAQSPDPFLIGSSHYQPEIIEGELNYPLSGWLPEEWTWYGSQPPLRRAACCGIFGGNRIDFIKHFADLAWQIIMDDRNRERMQRLCDKGGQIVLIEQYLLSACVEYHRHHSNARFRGTEIRYLFNSMADAFHPARAREAGYTHLMSEAKQNPFFARRIELRVRREYPQFYDRCRRVIAGPERGGNVLRA
jgi:uncharacterized protein DUF6734